MSGFSLVGVSPITTVSPSIMTLPPPPIKIPENNKENNSLNYRWAITYC